MPPTCWPWGAKTRITATVESEQGLPIPGKGENSHDCGDDAYYSIGTRLTSVVTRQQFGGGSPGDLAPTTRARGDTSINSTGVINLTLDPVSVTVLAVRGTYGG